MPFRLHAARQALKLGLVVGAVATLAGLGRVAADTHVSARPAGTIALRDASPALATAPVQGPRTAEATGTVELPPGAAGEPGRARLAASEYDYGRARVMNAALAFSKAPLIAARPFVLTGAEGDRARALTCLTQAVYYEAGFEPAAGQRAVAQVVLNRMRHPLFPHSVCGVVFQGAVTPGGGCQFSFTCDGSLGRGVPAALPWKRAQDVAKAALAGYVEAPVGLATHYHADYVAPYWMTTVTKLARVGAHIFYRWPGALGLPAAFGQRYAAVETIPSLSVLMANARARSLPGAATFKPGEGVTLGSDGAIYVAQADEAGGRVHGRFANGGDADSDAATPTARRAALLAGRGGSLPPGMETLAPPKPDAPAAAQAAPAPPSAGES